MEEPVFFPSRSEWRKWLSLNFSKASEVWLVIYKKHASKAGLTLGEAVEEAIRFGWIDGKLKRLDADRFALRFTPRKTGSVWSKINKDTADRLIASGRMAPAGLVKVEEAKKSGAWDSAYTNLQVEPTPQDLQEALEKKPLAWKNFGDFANTYRNTYIGWVNQTRNPQTRQKRIEKVVEQSLKNKKQIGV